MTVDVHVHAFVDGLPLAAGRRYTPARSAPLAELLSVLDGAGVQRALLVQPSFLADQHAYLLECLAQHPDRLRGVASLLDPDEALGRHAAWHAAGVRGIRLNLPELAVPDLSTGSWPALARLMAGSGWHLEVHATGDQWPALAGPLAEWPGPVVLDHLGRAGDPDTRRLVVGLAELAHVWVKVSAPYRTPDDGATDTARRILTSTGGRRLLWGSDWPFTGHEDVAGYPDQRAWAARVLGPTATELDGNAGRLLSWP